jgi:nucleoside-diphosphate-sugar epimerase
LRGEPITPFKHTQHRPMLYVDIQDVCKSFQSLAASVLNRKPSEQNTSIVNVLSPHPVTIIELARIVRHKFIRLTDGRIRPKIEVIDKGIEPLYTPHDKRLLKVDISKAREILGLGKLIAPSQTIERIIRKRIDLLSHTKK